MDKIKQFLSVKNDAIEIQTKLSRKIKLINCCNVSDINKIAGVDLAYWKEKEEEYAVCCIVVLDRDTKEMAESQYSFGRIRIPYIPGCLAFRELPLILETVQKLNITPDLYMFDGNGYLHPRHMGIATHASFYLKKPTIGVAKSYYKINGVDFDIPSNEKNAYTDIIINGEIYGRALRTVKDVKPIFISAGNYIDLDTTTKIVCEFINKESHIPLPTRLADIATHKMRKKLQIINR